MRQACAGKKDFPAMMEYLTDSMVLSCILLTLKVAGVASAIAFGLGLLLSWFMVRRKFPGKRWIDALCALPLVLPPTVTGYFLIMLIGRRGVLGQWLNEVGINLIFSWEGAVVAATVVIFPLTYRSTKAALESVDHNLENAARTLGASEWRVFTKISIPLARNGIFAGLALAFARGMGEFGATLMIAGNLPGKTQTLSLAVYAAFQAGDDAKAITLVLLTSVICITLLVAAEFLTSRGGVPRRSG